MPVELPNLDIFKRNNRFVTAPSLQFTESVRLKCIIEEHHNLYIQFFGPLKPKHHILTHYPTIFDQCGPFVHYWAMRSEQKHRQSKFTANVSCNFKNISHTLAIKSQLKLCHQLLSEPGEATSISFGRISIMEEDIYKSYFMTIPNKQFFCVSWVDINGTIYKPGMMLITCSTF